MPAEIGPELRRQVAARASHCWEYCLLADEDAGFPHQVDHIMSRKHGGESGLGNLAYACVACNRHKGADIAPIDRITGRLVRLYDPRTDAWPDHFYIDEGHVRPLTAEGRVTAEILQLNAAERVEERRALQTVGRYPPR